MGMRARGWSAGAALLASGLLLTGCTVPAGEPLPIYDLFTVGQQRETDRLSPHSPALWSVHPATTRSLGEVEGFEFFVALSARDPWNPFCIVVSGDLDDAVHCGQETFEAEYSGDFRFQFDAGGSATILTGEAAWQFGPYLAVEVAAPSPPEIIEIPLFALEQEAHDLLPEGASSRTSVKLETTRLYGEHDGRQYFVARPMDTDALVCVVVTAEDQELMSACGDEFTMVSLEDTGNIGSGFRFSYTGRTYPETGWVALGDHLSVRDTTGED
jgi:hypothetical protein